MEYNDSCGYPLTPCWINDQLELKQLLLKCPSFLRQCQEIHQTLIRRFIFSC